MPSVTDNTKYRCNRCGTIVDIPNPMRPPTCPVCLDPLYTDYSVIRVATACDFCGSVEDVNWTYPCHSYLFAPIPGTPVERKVGAWCACEGCHDLIEAANWDGVLARYVEVTVEKNPELLPPGVDPAVVDRLLAQFADALWGRFRDNRFDQPYRHIDGPPDGAEEGGP